MIKYTIWFKRNVVASLKTAVVIVWLVPLSALAQNSQNGTHAVLDVGIRLQKAIGLYTENGILAQYTSPKLASKRLYIGASYVTSRLGTAINSNAIKQDNVLLYAAYYFRPRWLIVRLSKPTQAISTRT